MPSATRPLPSIPPVNIALQDVDGEEEEEELLEIDRQGVVFTGRFLGKTLLKKKRSMKRKGVVATQAKSLCGQKKGTDRMWKWPRTFNLRTPGKVDW